MRVINTVIFIALLLFCAGSHIAMYLTKYSLSDSALFAQQTNSTVMYTYILIAMALLSFISLNIFRIKHCCTEVILMYVYMFYAFMCLVLNISFYPDIKSIGTTLVFAFIPPALFISFYYLGRENFIKEKYILGFFLILFLYETILLKQSGISATMYVDKMFLSTRMYYTFLLIPWLYCYRNNIVVITLTFISFLTIVYGNERAAFLAIAVGLFLYTIIRYYIIENNKIIYFITPIFLIALIYSAFYLLDTSYILERFKSLEEDAGSGRAFLWPYIINHSFTTGTLEIFIGHGGYFSTERIVGTYAHNDYIQALYDYGIFGVAILITLLFLAIYRCWNMIKLRYEWGPAFAVFLSLFLIIGCTNDVYFRHIQSFGIFSFWGYALGRFQNATTQKKQFFDLNIRNKLIQNRTTLVRYE